jgi:hypothetical protein
MTIPTKMPKNQWTLNKKPFFKKYLYSLTYITTAANSAEKFWKYKRKALIGG